MKPHLVPVLAIALFGIRTAKLIFLSVVLLFGFACGYGVRAWISRRRRRYRQRRSNLVQSSDEVAKLEKLRAQRERVVRFVRDACSASGEAFSRAREFMLVMISKITAVLAAARVLGSAGAASAQTHRHAGWATSGWVPILVVATLVAATIVAVPCVRRPVLRAAGWALVVNERITPADIIVISLDAGGAGALEAADLVQSGIAPRVAVFSGPPSLEDHEFIRRGVPYENKQVS
jgi:hypothetical protein